MIAGVGIDIIETARVRRMMDEFGDRFLSKLFTDDEIDYCRGKNRPEINLAARFAAKEAALKALGTGLSGGIGWKDISTRVAENGNPELRLRGVARRVADELGVTEMHLSISHTGSAAAAVVVFENRGSEND